MKKSVARFSILCILFILLAAPSMNFDVMLPAAVGFPPHIKSVAMIDRSTPAENIENVIRTDDIHYPRTRLIVLENTHNLCNGSPISADYMQKVGKLAKHYGLDGISGSRLRPVELPDASPRSGLFGKGGFLTATAFNNRTSPVLRGKWVLENLINMPPPAPPENVPALQVESGGKALTLNYDDTGFGSKTLG